jgi:hypothetical protein
VNSENQAKLLNTLQSIDRSLEIMLEQSSDTLASIARSLEAMLERLDLIEDRMTDILEALPGDEEEEP